jgi:predicted  nucleic acid-binding Zn-ribbon protein
MGSIDNAKVKIDQAQKQMTDAQYNLNYYRDKEAAEAENLQAAQSLLEEGKSDLEEAVEEVQDHTTGIGF